MKNNVFMHSDIAPGRSEMDALMSAVVESSAKNLRLAYKQDIKAKHFSVSDNSDTNTKGLLYFFASQWGHLCCGTIDPWYICKRVLDEEKEKHCRTEEEKAWCDEIYIPKVKDYYIEILERGD